jgi:type VI secretion system protein ImpK
VFISNNYFLINFQSLFYEILKLKEKALRARDTTIPSIQLMPSEGIALAKAIFDFIKKKLIEFFEKKKEEFNSSLVLSSSQANDALYIMVSYTDEVFLNLDWIGKNLWENSMLEAYFFKTKIAGDEIFEKINLIIHSSDPLDRELALLYFLILSLGFRGNSNDKKIFFFTDELYKLLHQNKSTFLLETRLHLIDSAYESTITDTLSKALPNTRLWIISLVSLILLYLLTTAVLWYHFSSLISKLDGINIRTALL